MQETQPDTAKELWVTERSVFSIIYIGETATKICPARLRNPNQP